MCEYVRECVCLIEKREIERGQEEGEETFEEEREVVTPLPHIHRHAYITHTHITSHHITSHHTTSHHIT